MSEQKDFTQEVLENLQKQLADTRTAAIKIEGAIEGIKLYVEEYRKRFIDKEVKNESKG